MRSSALAARLSSPRWPRRILAMAQYSLRDVDDRLWSQFMVRAQMEGWPLRALLLQLAADYVAGAIKPTTAAPMAPAKRTGPYVTLRFTCPHCQRAMEVDILHTAGFAYMSPTEIPCPACHRVTERVLPGRIMAGPTAHGLAIRPAGDAAGS